MEKARLVFRDRCKGRATDVLLLYSRRKPAAETLMSEKKCR